MAKGARSSVIKRNKAKLRATVFGPVVDQRTERLSAKLQKLASETAVKDAEMADADVNLIEKPNSSSMEIDEVSENAKPEAGKGSSGTGGIRKRIRRKTRPSITFKPHLAKAKRVSKKKK